MGYLSQAEFQTRKAENLIKIRSKSHRVLLNVQDKSALKKLLSRDFDNVDLTVVGLVVEAVVVDVVVLFGVVLVEIEFLDVFTLVTVFVLMTFWRPSVVVVVFVFVGSATNRQQT